MRRPIPRRPGFRHNKPKRPWDKPVNFIGDKWRHFQSFSTKKKIAIVGGTGAALLIIIPLISYFYFARDISDPERLMNRNNTGIVITDRNDEVIYSFGKTTNESLVRLDEVPEHLKHALLASEDKDFYEHGGFSIKSIAGAMYANVSNKDLTMYGGSTITQQLVKNTLLTDRKNFLRKYQELAMSIAIERHYTKDEILEMYLNSVYYGEGAFGIDKAAETYFNKSPSDLTLAESSILIGLLPAPSHYSPISGDIEKAESQQQRVLKLMAELDYISETEAEATANEPIKYAEGAESAQKHAHHFTDIVIAELEERYGEERVARSGFRVRTSLDLKWQQEAEATIARQIEWARHQGATNASLVAIEPSTGEIKALVGSVDWNNQEFGQVNMALTPRQPGSSFKPIYYAEALDKQLITPYTILKDEAKSYGDYRPQNFDRRFRGDVTVRQALATSLNIPAIEVLQKVGVKEASETAQRMGISTVNEPEKYGLSLALGTAETRLLDMTSAYAAFGNEGAQANPTTIVSIEDKFSKTIFTNKPGAKRVQSREASYLISSILSDNNARAPLFGSSLNIDGRQVAVKTGTTDDNKDAWSIGYTPSLAIGVWVGDNKHAPMSIGGGAAAGPIWRSSMQSMLADTPSQHFPQPSRIISTLVCGTGNTYTEFFIRGTEPKTKCIAPDPEAEQKKKDEEERRKREEEEKKKQEEEEEETPVVPEEPEEPLDPENPEEPEDPEEPAPTPPPPIVPPVTLP